MEIENFLKILWDFFPSQSKPYTKIIPKINFRKRSYFSSKQKSKPHKTQKTKSQKLSSQTYFEWTHHFFTPRKKYISQKLSQSKHDFHGSHHFHKIPKKPRRFLRIFRNFIKIMHSIIPVSWYISLVRKGWLPDKW